MLIRFVIDNLFSFGEQKEFSMIPNNRLRTLTEHAQRRAKDFDVLKLASIYGANGSGKSNLIKSITTLKDLVNERAPISFINKNIHKWSDSDKQSFAIEFIQNETAFYYAVEVKKARISIEELYESGLGLIPDKLVYERKTNSKGITKIKFLDVFEKDDRSTVLKEVLLQEFVKPNKTVLKLLSQRENEFLGATKKAYEWFSQTLEILSPSSKPRGLSHLLDIDPQFKTYAESLMCSFKLGITNLTTKTRSFKEFAKTLNEENRDTILQLIESDPDGEFSLDLKNQRDEVTIVRDGENILVKHLILGHKGGIDSSVKEFSIGEESDGTIRLIDFIPAFQKVISFNKVLIVDEIERSIHPSFIKELITKFSLDSNTNGQLIFTTHESNLLDQEIFRTDEIWFAEKNKVGSTDLYSLSDFKEHKTIDIQKGYLSGRYGSIPFMGDLKQLNWHFDDSTK